MKRFHLQQMLCCGSVIWLAIMAGCGRNPHQATLDRLHPDRVPVAKFAGRVTVDGTPQSGLFLRLVPVGDKTPNPENPQTFADEDGGFSFSTYLEGDGAPLGKYHLLVEKLKSLGEDNWSGPDELKNLFNHLTQPVQTLEIDQDVTDMQINLEVEGKSPRKEPAYGVTRLGDRRGGRG